ncbi:CarD family transcriptional regulator [Bradyrhizobium sp. WSM 4400]|nr:CarD family transcriptional regulator [Bradyrhizobium australafricanum]
MIDRVAHALSVVKQLSSAADYERARTYANTQQSRYRTVEHQSGVAREIGRGGPAQTTIEPAPISTAPTALTNSEASRPDLRPLDKAEPSPAPRARVTERQGFRANEFIVYPAHGVGQILAIEEQEIAGAKLELFVINFMKDGMTLRVPTAKVANVGMRKLSNPSAVQKAYRTLAQPPNTPEAEWSVAAQEYEAKINSGSIIAIAEVVRDLYRGVEDEEQEYSERQLYEAALDRLTREASIVRNLTNKEAIKECESLLIASTILRSGAD